YGYALLVHDYRGAHVLWHAGLIPGFGALLQMVPMRRFAVIVLANRSGSLLNKTAEKVMELMLPLAAKAEARSEEAVCVSETERTQYVGTYTNKPESVEIVVKQGRLVLKQEDGEFP